MNINEIEYKGYIGSVEYSDDGGVFHGKVLYVEGLLSYEGKNIAELKKDFHECIDEYLNMCKQNNIKPITPCKGSFNVRTTPELHLSATSRAKKEGITLNKLVNNALIAYLK